jgi:zinc protease
MQGLEPQIPVEAINQYIAEAITDSNIVVCVTGPEKDGVTYPTAEEIKAAIKEVSSEDVAAYVDEVNNEPLITKEIVPGRVIAELEGSLPGTIEWILSNGARVVIKKTDFKDDEIIMNAISEGGMMLYGADDAEELKSFGYFYESGGLGNFSTTNLRKALAGKKASVGMGINTFSESVSGHSAVKDLETMLQLTYLTFTDIRKDQEAFDINKNQYYNMLMNNASNPQFIFSDKLRGAMYNNNPLFGMMKAEDLTTVSYDRILEIAKERTANAADFTFNFVGAIDLEVLRPLVEKYIASLPGCTDREKVARTALMSRGEKNNNFSLPMENPAATVYVIYTGDSKYNLRKSIMMSMFSQIMDIVYTETIREQEGGTYGVGTSASISSYNNEWMFLFGFDTNVEKCIYLKERAQEELMKVVNGGVREEDFNKVKEYMIKEYANDQRENNYWAGVLTSHVLGNNIETGYLRALETISMDELNLFISTLFLDNENVVEQIMTGETK